MHTINLISLFVLLVLVSIAAMFIRDGIRFLLVLSKSKANNKNDTASVQEARPDQVVSPIQQPQEATAPIVAAKQNFPEQDAFASESTSVDSFPSSLNGWHEYDEPTCLRKGQAFVFA